MGNPAPCHAFVDLRQQFDERIGADGACRTCLDPAPICAHGGARAPAAGCSVRQTGREPMGDRQPILTPPRRHHDIDLIGDFGLSAGSNLETERGSRRNTARSPLISLFAATGDQNKLGHDVKVPVSAIVNETWHQPALRFSRTAPLSGLHSRWWRPATSEGRRGRPWSPRRAVRGTMPDP